MIRKPEIEYRFFLADQIAASFVKGPDKMLPALKNARAQKLKDQGIGRGEIHSEKIRTVHLQMQDMQFNLIGLPGFIVQYAGGCGCPIRQPGILGKGMSRFNGNQDPFTRGFRGNMGFQRFLGASYLVLRWDSLEKRNKRFDF